MRRNKLASEKDLTIWVVGFVLICGIVCCACFGFVRRQIANDFGIALSTNFANFDEPSCWEGYSGNSSTELAAHVGVPLAELESLPNEVNSTPRIALTYIDVDPGRRCGVQLWYRELPVGRNQASILIHIYNPLTLSQYQLLTPLPTTQAEVLLPWTCGENPNVSRYPTRCVANMRGFYIQVLLTYSIERAEVIVSGLRLVN